LSLFGVSYPFETPAPGYQQKIPGGASKNPDGAERALPPGLERLRRFQDYFTLKLLALQDLPRLISPDTSSR
jgi:hypothetical protein